MVRRPGSRFRLNHWTPRESDVLAGGKQLLAVHPAVAWAARNNVGKGHVVRPDFTKIDPYPTLRRQLDKCVEAGFLNRNQITWLEWGEVGASDMIGFLKGGRFLAVETKRPGERATQEQAQFIDMVNECGGLGICVSDVQELANALSGNL